MNFLAWFMRDDLLWAWVTIVLSSMIIIGYCVTAINWYFQSKVSREESSWTLRRLRNICIVCAICGYVFYVAEMPWLVWRSYDAALLVFVCHTWWYVFRMSGPSLVNERLAQMHELE